MKSSKSVVLLFVSAIEKIPSNEASDVIIFYKVLRIQFLVMVIAFVSIR